LYCTSHTHCTVHHIHIVLYNTYTFYCTSHTYCTVHHIHIVPYITYTLYRTSHTHCTVHHIHIVLYITYTLYRTSHTHCTVHHIHTSLYITYTHGKHHWMANLVTCTLQNNTNMAIVDNTNQLIWRRWGVCMTIINALYFHSRHVTCQILHICN